MPDKHGNKEGPGLTDTPDQAYKDHRPEDIEGDSADGTTKGEGNAHSGGFGSGDDLSGDKAHMGPDADEVPGR